MFRKRGFIVQDETLKTNKLYSFFSRILPASKKDLKVLSDEISDNKHALEEQIERLEIKLYMKRLVKSIIHYLTNSLR